jgi:hypothetical protein
MWDRGSSIRIIQTNNAVTVPCSGKLFDEQGDSVNTLKSAVFRQIDGMGMVFFRPVDSNPAAGFHP